MEIHGAELTVMNVSRGRLLLAANILMLFIPGTRCCCITHGGFILQTPN
jgi:hypothetical protein